MIAWLSGNLRGIDEGRLILDVGGVGYVLQVPVGVGGQTAIGEALEVHVHTHVREDQISLFGFDTPSQVLFFQKLLGVSGVGPKSALSLLSVLGPEQLAAAIEGNDVAALTQANGIGKRGAERIAVELKGKLEALLGDLPTSSRNVPKGPAVAAYRDLRSALLNLQYRPKEIEAAFDQLQRELPEETAFELLLRGALKHLKK